MEEYYNPKLQRQRSTACAALDVRILCNSRRSAGFSRTFADEFSDDDLEPMSYSPARSAGTRLRGLWRRIMREKRRILRPAGSYVHEPYDPYTYAQNFDEGSAAVEPENLSRSFSARFAAPSRMLQRIA